MSDESLFREVDEEVRQEQLKKLWAKHGNLITALVVGLVLAVAAYKGWQYWQLKQSEAAGATFFQATSLIAEGKHDEAEKLLGGITHTGFATLARFRTAADYAAQGKVAEAIKAYDALAADTAIDATLRDLARVRGGYLKVDSVAPEDLVKQLGDLDKDDGSWRLPVREIIGLSAYRTQQYQMADKYLNMVLADRETSAGMRQRVQMVEDLLTPLLDKPKP